MSMFPLKLCLHLDLHLHLYLFIYLSIYPSCQLTNQWIYASIHLSMPLSVSISTCLSCQSTNQPLYLPTCLSVDLSMHLCTYLYLYLFLYLYILFQPVSSISVTPSVNVVPYVVLNVLKISPCKKPCCSWCSRTGLWKKLCCKSRFGQDKHMAWKNQWPKVEQWCSFWVCSYLGR